MRSSSSGASARRLRRGERVGERAVGARPAAGRALRRARPRPCAPARTEICWPSTARIASSAPVRRARDAQAGSGGYERRHGLVAREDLVGGARGRRRARAGRAAAARAARPVGLVLDAQRPARAARGRARPRRRRSRPEAAGPGGSARRRTPPRPGSPAGRGGRAALRRGAGRPPPAASGRAAGRAAPATAPGLRSSAIVGASSGERHASCSFATPACATTASQNARPSWYWRSLSSRPRIRSSSRSAGRAVPAAGVERLAQAVQRRQDVARRGVHRPLRVPLDERHRRLDPLEQAAPARARDGEREAALAHRVGERRAGPPTWAAARSASGPP